MRRFFSSEAYSSRATITLGADEAAHIHDVLRLREGSRIAVFNGLGGEFVCEISSITKRSAELSIVSSVEPPSKESPLDLTLAAALLKNDKFDLVVQKAVEIGVTTLVPIVAARCEIPLKVAGKRISRWERIVIEASKQCGRATLMKIGAVMEFDRCVRDSETEGVMFVERGGSGFPSRLEGGKITAFVGPEGGWEDDEISAAESAGLATVTLGGRTLRAETAAIAVAALIQHRFGDLR
jgi:16S rRNA (uracil1498-N3)-methyltransferase